MPRQQLYEDAIADVKQLRSVVEDNAKRAIIEALGPRVKALIEEQIMGDVDGSLDVEDEINPVEPTAVVAQSPAAVPVNDGSDAISMPDEQGKVTLDLDALGDVPADGIAAPKVVDVPGAEDEFTLNSESIKALQPLLAGGRLTDEQIELQTFRLGESIAQFSNAGKLVRRSPGFRSKISEMISRVKNTYECVQDTMSDPAKKRVLEQKLEAFNRALGRLMESPMANRRDNSRLTEGDVTLKLTGLPDELDLDGVGVDLIKDEDEEGAEGAGGGDELDLDAGEGGAGGGGGDDLDLGADDKDKPMGEGRRMSDDTIVEIDNNMLRAALREARGLREEAVPSTKGTAPKGKVLSDFGDGKSVGDPWLNGEVTTESDEVPVAEGEGAGDDETIVELVDEEEEETAPPMHEEEAPPAAPMGEARIQRAIAREKRIQESLAGKMKDLQSAGRRAKRMGRAAALKEAKTAFMAASKSLAESKARAEKFTKTLTESAAPRAGVRSNSAPRRTTTEGGADDKNLRSQLMQSNLRNAKLTATTKLLQNESLTNQQRADIVEQLESAKTSREVKLVFESIMKTIVKGSEALSETANRRVPGSSSRAVRPGSSPTALNESNEAARWARLAGING